MSKAVRKCLDRADELRTALLDERYESLLEGFLRSDTARETLDAACRADREAVERLALCAPKERDRMLKPMTTERQIVLLTASVRYCLEAASILEGFERHIENRPVDLTVISAAHRAHAWLYEDDRADWPESAGLDLSFFR